MKEFLKKAIEDLDEYYDNAGCNDLILKDTPENRLLWDEYQAWNFRIPIEKVKTHKEYEKVCVIDGELYCHDGLVIFVLKRALGLL